MRHALGNEAGSLEDVAHALRLAEREEFISPFVEEGQSVARALEALLKQSETVAPFIERILECFPAGLRAAQAPTRRPEPAAQVEELIEPLTPREVEVLQRIAAGDSNQAIADRLVVTLSAVKKHTGNIFRKLGVNSRTQALVRARELRLLAPGE